MCGIAGFLDPWATVAVAGHAALAEHMADALVHRGPDDAGAWTDERAGLAFGFRRLAVVDPSPDGHQPMHSTSGRYVIVFNGEVYNHADLRRTLDQHGAAAWRGRSDTEVLLEAIAHWGIGGTLDRIDGMFAFALWDRQTLQLTLARDRMGEKPLYYGRLGRAFVFASEPKALRRHPAWDGTIDRDAIALYLRHGYVPGPATAWRAVRKLQPGCRLDIGCDGGTEGPQPYWCARATAEAAAAAPFDGDDAAAEEALDSLIRRSVGRRMLADVPVGAFLSGGIDSSTIAAAMQAESTQRVRTFSIGFEETRFDEAPHAAAVAAHLGTDHTALRIAPADCRAVIPRLAGIYDEPFADASQIPTLVLCELTRRHVTVGLSGDGGDELFGGYERYGRAAREWRRSERLRAAAGPLAAVAGAALPAATLDGWLSHLAARRPPRIVQKLQQRLLSLGYREPARLWRDSVSWWHDTDGIHVDAAPPSGFERPGALASFPDLRQQFMFADATTYLPDDLLVKIDRASMAASLEARAPLLDPAIVAFSWSLPAALCFRNGGGKWLLRRVLARYVPAALVDRPKQGFEVPIGDWLRGPLKGWADDMLSAGTLATSRLVNPAAVVARWDEHRRGVRNWAYPLWTVLMLQAWHAEQEPDGRDRGAAYSRTTSTEQLA